ncbi:MAG: adenylyltransferase/cytidyltransferase family protein [Nitrospirae bacterium]|nr:adenylyltransferase/cytidyltransferase family protein [Nitrospirota bacterium]
MPLNPESIAALQDIKEEAKNKRIVFVSGNFNILHPGHLRLLRFAKECGDYLIVGVLGSESKGVVINEVLRLEGVKAISLVDYSFVLHDTPADFIEELRPDFVVKGKEHEDRFNPETEVLARSGGKLIFGSGDIIFSSVDLMKHEWKELNRSSIKLPADFLSRHQFDFGTLQDILVWMKGLKVCVLGDIIIDEYITCDALGMSQEDPTIVVTPILQEKFMGGAGIVASHARGLRAAVHLFTTVGSDETADFAKDNLSKIGVEAHFYVDDSRPTTLKQRFRTGQKTLLRVSHMRQHAISAELRNRMCKDVFAIMDDIDLLIFADFNYGCLPQPFVKKIIAECEKRGIMMVADSQSSSQVGDISRFRKMTLVTPTEREARLAVRDFESGLVVLAEKLRQKAHIRNVVLTLAEEGVLIHAETTEKNTWLTDRLPAFNLAPKDVSGAGDSFMTCASMAMAVGADIWQSSYLGSLASACQVGRLGNIPLTPDDLILEITG